VLGVDIAANLVEAGNSPVARATLMPATYLRLTIAR